MRRKNWAERLVAAALRWPGIVLVTFAALILSSVVTLTDSGKGVWGWYRDDVQWRDREYEKLNALRAGFTIHRFEEALGAPVFQRPSDDGQLVETTFQGRSYWVQAVADRARDEVVLFSVTSCSKDFNPTFRLPDDVPITLNASHLSDIGAQRGSPGGVLADYFAPAATANAHFVEFIYGGNPGNYKSFAWGFNDACLDLPGWGTFIRDPVGLFGTDGGYKGPAGVDSLQPVRERIPVNTYAETAPLADLKVIRRSFQIGVDRILIRTVTHPSYEPPEGAPPQTTQIEEPVPIGSKALVEAWGCYLTDLPGFVQVMDKREIREVAEFAPAHIPEAIRHASGGYLLLSGLTLSPSRRQSAALAFTGSVREARRIQQGLREPVDRLGNAVVTWDFRPTAAEHDLVQDCLPHSWRATVD